MGICRSRKNTMVRIIANVKTADSSRFKTYFSKGFHNLPGVFPGAQNARKPGAARLCGRPGRKNGVYFV